VNGRTTDENMIILCERCFAPVEEDEPMVREGTAHGVYTYRHLGRCAVPRRPLHGRPNTGAWNPQRGIGVLRTLYG
jgi:hypothetical protein